MKNLGYMIKNKKTRRGFTLVEVIVVLVILAILAAILVPKLTGWIDESKGKSAIGEGHLVLSAAQAAATQAYGIADSGSSATDGSGFTRIYTNSDRTNAVTFIALCGEDVNVAAWCGRGVSDRKNGSYGLISYLPEGNNVNAKPSTLYSAVWAKNSTIQPFAYLATNNKWVVYRDKTFDTVDTRAEAIAFVKEYTK